ncbi:hypothetical protein Y1Q_0020538 [Alligator mississippiensis]|uniref:Uncharacterized protein n=1 Tax=Alligator mississippiensis TaxID=8496 RepID=A0A151P3X5_ALLMI|nr:hypothetical protein Y1Q_0020538 [Alligator mississippiensis]
MGRPWLVLLLALALLEAALAGHILQELLDRERGAAQDGDQAEDSLRERLGKEKAAAEELSPSHHTSLAGNILPPPLEDCRAGVSRDDGSNAAQLGPAQTLMP